MRITDRPYALSTSYGNNNSSTLSTIKRRAEKEVFPSEVIYYPNGLGMHYRAFWLDSRAPCALFRYDMDGDTLGMPLFGDVAEIQAWLNKHGLQIASRTIAD